MAVGALRYVYGNERDVIDFAPYRATVHRTAANENLLCLRIGARPPNDDGEMVVHPNDYVVRHGDDTYTVEKPDAFFAKYEMVLGDHSG